MIKCIEKSGKRFFLLKNDNLACLLQIKDGAVLLLHFGRPIAESDAETMTYNPGPGWGTAVMSGDMCLDSLPLAWSCTGNGDYRESPVELLSRGENIVPDFRYSGYRIFSGPAESELPGAEGDCETLEISLTGWDGKLELLLYFSLFETAMTRRTVLKNKIKQGFTLLRLMSSLMDLRGNYAMTTLDGGWIAEAHAHTAEVSYSKCVNESLTGFSSNRHNPAFMLKGDGGCYGFNLVYSGNHYASAQKSHQNLTRVVQGINPSGFSLEIGAYGSFETPEAVMCWSDGGENGLRRMMHRFVNEHIVPEYWRYRERPVLYNSWEGSMFSFNEKKLLALASGAKKLGCELFVLDDGWFGARNSDTAGLGDYDVNTDKLPEGLEGLSKKLNDMGLQFGLWFEPEAVNPDSKLFRRHPGWAIPGPLGRNELLLDLRKKEVRDYIVENVSAIIDRANIKYVKWDMNRHSCLAGAAAHEYILGLYDVLGRIFKPRPEVLLESCASGGNRFDLGMLCCGPQIWASDNTDPIERLDIQQGLSLFYPQSAMGSHVSASAHIQTLRETPLSTRVNVSYFGVFGIELEPKGLLAMERRELEEAVEYYKAHRKTFQFGQFSVNDSEEGSTCWQLSSDKEAIAGLFHRLVHSAQGYEWLKAELPWSGKCTVTSRPQYLRVGRFASMTKHILPVQLNPNGIIMNTADHVYQMKDGEFSCECSSDALRAGIPLNLKFTGTGYDPNMRNQGDFGSNIYLIKKKGII